MLAIYFHEETTISVTLFNTIGQIINKKDLVCHPGMNTIDIFKKELSLGFYFLNVSSNKLNKTIKVIKTNDGYPSTKSVFLQFQYEPDGNSKTIIQNVGDTYNFKGFYKYLTDTVDSVKATSDFNVTFQFEIDTNKFAFNEISFTLDSIIATGDNSRLEDYSLDLNFSPKNTLTFQDLKFGYGYQKCDSCTNLKTNEDSTAICYQVLEDNSTNKHPGGPYLCIQKSVVLKFDKRGNNISYLKIYHLVGYFSYTMYYYSYERITELLILENIPFIFDSEGNIIVELKYDDLTKNVRVIKLDYYRNSLINDIHGGVISEGTYHLNNFYSYQLASKLKIKLTHY